MYTRDLYYLFSLIELTESSTFDTIFVCEETMKFIRKNALIVRKDTSLFSVLRQELIL